MPPVVTLTGRRVRLEPLSLHHVGPLLRAATQARDTYAFTLVPADEGAMTRYVQAALADQGTGWALPFALFAGCPSPAAASGITRDHECSHTRFSATARIIKLRPLSCGRPIVEQRGVCRMKKPVWVLVGAAIALAGLLFTLQGVGVISGSTMSSNSFWAFAGPAVLLLGLALAGHGVRGRTRWRPHPGSRGRQRDEAGADEDGAPVGRRVVLGLIGVGALGVATGHRVQDQLARTLGPIAQRDPTGLLSLIPLGDTFRFYSVTGPVRQETAATYRLRVSGLVAQPAVYSLSDLKAMPRTALVQNFQCVTGWQVPDVHWAGVRLSTLIARAQPSRRARAVRFTSFDGTYTGCLTLEQARRSDVIVALEMLGGPVTHDHGGPVRVYAGSMYGYKSTKWLSGIELTDHEIPGYWETRGYDIDGSIEQ